jgi:hypothetical protein
MLVTNMMACLGGWMGVTPTHTQGTNTHTAHTHYTTTKRRTLGRLDVPALGGDEVDDQLLGVHEVVIDAVEDEGGDELREARDVEDVDGLEGHDAGGGVCFEGCVGG